MNERKKPNIVLYTLLMIALFAIVVEGIIWGYGGSLLYAAIKYYPQGELVIKEALIAFLVLILLLIFKNSYVFTQKREKFKVGLFYGLFYLIGSAFFFIIFGIFGGCLESGLTLINLILGSFLVGICEELLCRGWLLNEFLERYGDTKKGVWYSIIISGTIFGLMHLGNIIGGQDVVGTIVQVISACGTGIMFGLIYYKTKNIWSVICLHSLWDFSLFLGEVIPVTEKTASVTAVSIVGLLLAVLAVMAELLNAIPHMKDIDAPPKKKPVIILAIVSIILYVVLIIISGAVSSTLGDTYTYDNLELKNYAVTRDNYETYKMKYNNYTFTLTNDKSNLILTNVNTQASVTIECDKLYDYIIMEQDENYILAYIDYTDDDNVYLNYIYISKQALSDETSFLNMIQNNIKKYLIKERAELVVVSDYENNKSYLSAYNVDYGHYVLLEEGKMAIINRDKK